MATVPDFTDVEHKLVARTLLERYGHAVACEAAEAEIGTDADGGDLAGCPILYWQERGAHFVVFKLAEGRFRGQFFYSDTTQYGTGRDSFDNLGDCVITLLQVQSDHERQMAGIRSGMTSKDIENGDDYDGPLVV